VGGTPHCLRQADPVVRIVSAVLLIILTGCAGRDQVAPPRAGSDDGPLFATVLKDINRFYIEPVSMRAVALAGAARLGRLDQKLAVGDSLGAGTAVISYEDRNREFLPTPSDNDAGAWGAFLETVITRARQTSPRLAALPQEEVEQAVLSGMTASLDRFSRYASPSLAREQRATRDGYGGIGITIDGAHDTFRVTAVTPHGPADHAGIRPEDQIVAINGVPTAGCVHHDVLARLRGPVGSPINVKVLPLGESLPRQFRLRRASVFEPTVTAAREGDIAVIGVHSFNHSTTQRVAEALSDLQRQAGGRLAGIVLDLRSNPGGVLDQAVSLADLFLSDGPIVSVVGRHPASRQYFKASGRGVAPQLPLAVLINGGSASASEIVAAALQDAGRAVVIGTSSYGKGTVQTVLRLPNNGELILTWARLVSPSGYLLQRHGVIPAVCTADLSDDANSLALGLRRAATPPSQPRVSLDERSWSMLRQSCPGRRTRPAVDVALAKRLFAEPALYAEALRANRAAQVAQTSAALSRALP
jgi:carboxyl-terminal processing protease